MNQHIATVECFPKYRLNEKLPIMWALFQCPTYGKTGAIFIIAKKTKYAFGFCAVYGERQVSYLGFQNIRTLGQFSIECCPPHLPERGNILDALSRLN